MKRFSQTVVQIKNADGEFEPIAALRGLSSYELAVQNGFEGTEDEWLETMLSDGWVGKYQELEAKKANKSDVYTSEQMDELLQGAFDDIAMCDTSKLVIQKITKSCTWEVPKAKLQKFKIFVVGGGGGGGVAPSYNGTEVPQGWSYTFPGGGGSGTVEMDEMTIPESARVEIYVGAGGIAGDYTAGEDGRQGEKGGMTGFVVHLTPDGEEGEADYALSAEGGYGGGGGGLLQSVVPQISDEWEETLWGKGGRGLAGGSGGTCRAYPSSGLVLYPTGGGDAFYGGGGFAGGTTPYAGITGGTGGVKGGNGGVPGGTGSDNVIPVDSMTSILYRTDKIALGRGAIGDGGVGGDAFYGGGGYCGNGVYGGGGYCGNGGNAGICNGGLCSGGGGGGFFCDGGNGKSSTSSSYLKETHYGGGGGGFFDGGHEDFSGGNGGVLIMYIKED